jgi:hypothetical protein
MAAKPAPPAAPAPSQPATPTTPKPRPAPAAPKTASQPAGSTVPSREAGPKPAGRPAGKLLEPLSFAEARKGLHAAHVGAAKLIGSGVELPESDFDTMGDAFKQVADRFVAIRIVLRVVAPLVLVGALVEVWRRILAETPWWQRLREGLSERQRRQEEANAQAKAVAEARAAGAPAPPIVAPASGPSSAAAAEPAETPPPLPRRGPSLGRYR